MMNQLANIALGLNVFAQITFAQNNALPVFMSAGGLNRHLDNSAATESASDCIALPAVAAYGMIQAGDQSHSDKVTYCFPGKPGDVVLSFQVYDIDTDKEVDVFINNAKIFDAPLTGINKWSGTLELLLYDNFVNNTGTNVVTFDNTKNPPNAWWWDVRQVKIEYCYTIPSPLGYGKIQGGDQSHADKVAYYFDGRPGDAYLSYQAYDIDGVNEVDLIVNGVKVQDVALTADNQSSGNRGAFLPEALIRNTGVNVIVFDNTNNPPQSFWWGVRAVSIQNCYPLPAASAFGKIRGGDETHVDKVAFWFTGQTGDLSLSYQAYGVDNAKEVNVVLNNVKIQNVPITGVQLWGDSVSVILPDTLVNDTGVNIVVFDNTKNPPKLDWWGIRKLSVGSTLSRTKALDAASSVLPVEFQLQQNYPNPFNPTTQLRYALPAKGHVTLSIYNSFGQEIRRLVDAEQQAGNHVVTWNGRDHKGKPVPSGVYHYRLQVGDPSAGSG